MDEASNSSFVKEKLVQALQTLHRELAKTSPQRSTEFVVSTKKLRINKEKRTTPKKSKQPYNNQSKSKLILTHTPEVKIEALRQRLSLEKLPKEPTETDGVEIETDLREAQPVIDINIKPKQQRQSDKQKELEINIKNIKKLRREAEIKSKERIIALENTYSASKAEYEQRLHDLQQFEEQQRLAVDNKLKALREKVRMKEIEVKETIDKLHNFFLINKSQIDNRISNLQSLRDKKEVEYFIENGFMKEEGAKTLNQIQSEINLYEKKCNELQTQTDDNIKKMLEYKALKTKEINERMQDLKEIESNLKQTLHNELNALNEKEVEVRCEIELTIEMLEEKYAKEKAKHDINITNLLKHEADVAKTVYAKIEALQELDRRQRASIQYRLIELQKKEAFMRAKITSEYNKIVEDFEIEKEVSNNNIIKFQEKLDMKKDEIGQFKRPVQERGVVRKYPLI